MAGLWSVALQAALDAFAALGIDAEAIRAEAGVDPDVLRDPDGRVPMEAGARIWPLAERAWAKPGLGLAAGAEVPFGKLQTLDYAMLNADTVASAVARFETFWDIVTGGRTGVEAELDEEDRLVIRFHGYALPQLRDYAVSLLRQRLHLMGAPPVAATIAGPPLSSVADYRTRLGCEATFHAEHTSLRLAPGAHRAPVPVRVPGLENLVNREIRRLLEAARQASDPVESVRAEILRSLGPTPPTIERTAERLGTSRRQLQRRLVAHDTSFRVVLDECRCSLAQQLLRGRSSSVEEIGYLLGYADPRAFTRAFKRWLDVTPAAFRARAALHRDSPR